LTDRQFGFTPQKSNVNNHAYLVEEIRRRVVSLERYEWKIMFSWVKAHF